METWKQIRTLNNYEISNYNRIRSVDRTVTTKDGLVTRVIKGKILTINKHNCGYMIVSICENNVKKNYCLHQLIALNAFEDYDPNVHCIDHIDRNKSNNDVSNLRIVTQRQNLINKHNSSIYGNNIYKTKSGTYQVKIYIQGKTICMGTYSTAEDANNIIQPINEKINRLEMNNIPYTYKRTNDYGVYNLELITLD